MHVGVVRVFTFQVRNFVKQISLFCIDGQTIGLTYSLVVGIVFRYRETDSSIVNRWDTMFLR